MRWGFATWVSDAPTGGNIYDRRLIAGLIELGTDLREYRVDGTWPHVSATERAQLAVLLEREQDWLIDAIVACAAPEVVAAAVAAGRRVVVLVHSFMADERWSSPAELRAAEDAERMTLQTATKVICTSVSAATEVTRRSGRSVAAIAYPGVDAARLAQGSAPPRILSLGTVCERKNQLNLIRALAELTDIAWTASIVGAVDIEPNYVAQVRNEIAARDLDHRIAVVGPRTGTALDDEWHAADLLVLTSWAETYGMVVGEALARGIPSVVTAGTGAEEAQAVGGAPLPGATTPAGDPAALATVLRRYLTDPEQRRVWREAAQRSRSRLPSWSDTANAVAIGLQHASLTTTPALGPPPAAPAARRARPSSRRPR